MKEISQTNNSLQIYQKYLFSIRSQKSKFFWKGSLMKIIITSKMKKIENLKYKFQLKNL